VKPGVYNLNKFRVVIEEASNTSRSHFVNEIKLDDDILITVKDSSKGGAAPGNLISLE
jgi:hypothetical protein